MKEAENKKRLDWKFFVGVLIILVIIWRFHASLTEQLFLINPFYVLFGSLVFLFIVFIKQFKWHVLLGQIERGNTALSIKSFFSGQFVNEVAPTGVGDLTKAYVIKACSRNSFGKALSVSYVERTMDVAVLSFLAIISSITLFLSFISSYISLIFIVVGFLAAFFFLIAIFPVKMAKVIAKILNILGKIIKISSIKNFVKKSESFIVNFAGDFQDALKIYKGKKYVLFSMLVLVFIDWFLEGIVQVLFLNSLGHSIPVLVSVGIVAISWLVSIPSMIPGGLGVREVILSLLFTAYGIPFATAFFVVLMYRLLVLLCFGIGLLVSLRMKIENFSISQKVFPNQSF